MNLNQSQDHQADVDLEAVQNLPDFLSRQPSARVYFACIHSAPFTDDSKTPVAFATTMLQFSSWSGKGAGATVMNIHDLFVKPDFRRKRIAHRLLDFVIDEARHMDCVKVP